MFEWCKLNGHAQKDYDVLNGVLKSFLESSLSAAQDSPLLPAQSPLGVLIFPHMIFPDSRGPPWITSQSTPRPVTAVSPAGDENLSQGGYKEGEEMFFEWGSSSLPANVLLHLGEQQRRKNSTSKDMIHEQVAGLFFQKHQPTSGAELGFQL